MGAVTSPLFDRVAIVGLGLIGSSLARAIAEKKLARELVGSDVSAAVVQRAGELGLCDRLTLDAGEAVRGADCVIICIPVGAYAALGGTMAAHLKPGAIVTDVGSVKQPVIRDLGAVLPQGVHLVPGHPIAGTEKSGPDAGFATLFEGRWAILTPPPGTPSAAVDQIAALWRSVGSMVDVMEAPHHDMVLAITSHLPHLIAYTIVGTATDLESSLQSEVIKYSASGFRDFTRIAASDPIMWRDILLNNREAVLEMLQRFTEDLTALQRAIRWGEGETLRALFERTRAIRRAIVDAKQA
jgi:cyclohexadieny/prephenate dehydrogenase